MYKLQAITLKNYRSFARPTTMELRPLTLLYGRNNAGKSALLSFLPMIAEAVSEQAAAPFPSRDPAGKSLHFRSDLVWKGSMTPTIEFTLHWRADSGECLRDHIKLEYRTDELGKSEHLLVQELRIENDKLLFHALRAPSPDENTPAEDAALYWPFRLRGKDIAETWKVLTFSGLLINDASGIQQLDEQRARLKSFRDQVQWLGSVRGQIPRTIVKPSEAPRYLGPDGSGAADVLLHRDDLFREVAQWYSDPRIGRRLEFSPIQVPDYRLLLRPLKQNWDIPIQQTGEGMNQVLPILVAASMAGHRKGLRVLAIEEPESHLHGDAVVALAGYLARIASEPEPPLIFLETHSRLLLLGLQLAVAQGTISSERVIAYWVDQQVDGSSEVLPVQFSREGKLEGWPIHVFREEMKLAKQLWDIEQANMSGG